MTRKTVFAWAPAIIWTIGIAWLSTGPGVSLPQNWYDLFAADKWMHLGAYGLLALLYCYAWEAQFESTKSISQKEVLGIIIVVSLYGFLMEVIQYLFYPSRFFEYLDILANIIGAYIGGSVYQKEWFRHFLN